MHVQLSREIYSIYKTKTAGNVFLEQAVSSLLNKKFEDRSTINRPRRRGARLVRLELNPTLLQKVKEEKNRQGKTVRAIVESAILDYVAVNGHVAS